MAETAADTSKFQTQIVIKPPPPPFATDLAENIQERKIPFFQSGSRRRRADTWVISVFVILHILFFITTMFVNDCWHNSHEQCALKSLGRLSFQPLSENPLLGPSASTLDEMGALRRTFLTKHPQNWRLFTFPCLHAGAIHLVVNLCSVIFVGIHLEQEFGPFRTGIIYILSAIVGSLVAALFVTNRPSVGSSGALFGLIGAMLSGIIRNWQLYSNKCSALVPLFFVALINFGLGLLPYVDNYANIGGFISGLLLGFMLLFSLQHRQAPQNKATLFSSDSIKLKVKQKLDRPVVRIVSLLLFGLILAGSLVAVLCGININRYCKWCRYVDCVPLKRWSCKDVTFSCERMVNNEQLTLTCMGDGNFKVLPFSNISQSRMLDLCSLICS